MEGLPQNPEFRINPENFHPCICCLSFETLVSSFNFLSASVI